MKRPLFYFLLLNLISSCDDSQETTAITPQNQLTGELLFQSPFNLTSTSIVPKGDGSNKNFDDFAGENEGYSWANKSQSIGGGVHIFYEGGEREDRKAVIAVENTLPGAPTSSNGVLSYQIYNGFEGPKVPVPKAKIDAQFYGIYNPKDNFNHCKELSVSVRLKLDAPSFGELASNPKAWGPGNQDWLTLQEHWNDNYTTNTAEGFNKQFRIGVNLRKGTGVNAGKFVINVVASEWRGGLTGNFVKVWSTDTKSDDPTKVFPIGEWVTIDTYMKQGDGSNGKFYLKLSSQNNAICDTIGWTMSQSGNSQDGFDSVGPMKLYTSKALVDIVNEAGKGPLRVEWDDLKIWSGKAF